MVFTVKGNQKNLLEDIEIHFVDKNKNPDHETIDDIEHGRIENRKIWLSKETNRGHWVIENTCHYIIDWNYDEDRTRIRTGYGPENITRLR